MSEALTNYEPVAAKTNLLLRRNLLGIYFNLGGIKHEKV